MNNDSPFKTLDETRPLVSVQFAGHELHLPLGANLAAALLATGITTFRTTHTTHSPRGPFCMMGACFDCLVMINGVTRQACMVEVSDGLVINQPHEDTDEAD